MINIMAGASVLRTQSKDAWPVDVWFLDIALFDPGAFDDLSALVTADERTAGDRYSDAISRRTYLARRALRRTLLGGYLGCPTEDLRFEPKSGGKPRLITPTQSHDLRFNSASSSGCAVVALAHGVEVGIDIEHIRRDVAIEDVADAYFTEGEKAFVAAAAPGQRHTAFYDIWTRKEALLKGIGIGLRRSPKEFDVSSPGPAATGATQGEFSGWSLQKLDILPGYAAALAVNGAVSAPRIRRSSLGAGCTTDGPRRFADQSRHRPHP